MAHELPMAGPVGIRKTEDRIMRHFYWPKMHKDVVHFCKTCHTCQIIGKAQPSIKPAPLIPIPAFEEPFTRVLVDCVGPLPRTRSGHRFLLTIMDLSTRFPETIPLRSITAKTVVQALVQFFTRYGLPKEIQCDQGSNFMSGIFQQVMKELGIRQIKSSAYHPQSQGALERYHQTLKTMIRAYCEDYPDDWDKEISFLLFATRDSPNESIGFSPFELVYGHEVRGPLKLIKERFMVQDDDVNLLDYVSKFRERLSKACDVAKEHLKVSQGKMKAQADKNAKERSFKPGDKVLVLLPLQGEPLKARFNGPYIVKKKLNDVNYVISTPDRRKSQRVCHVNMLKEYFEREASQPIGTTQVKEDKKHVDEHDEECYGKTDNELSYTDVSKNEPCGVKLSNSEMLGNMDEALKHLPEDQGNDISGLLREYENVCKDKPGRTPLTVHDVDVGDARPIKQKPYRLNPSKLEMVNKEIQFMLDNDIIEPSQSSWSSPIVMVPKPDGSQRFCIDYRKVNAVTKTDSYPISRLEDCIDRVGNSAYITKIDLLKGYWQVPLTDRAKEISAFVTPEGLFQCKVMPFGMKNAPATFQRLTNQVIAGLDNCVVYIDDILVYSDTWNDHLDHLRALFDRLDKANLVVNLMKSEFAKAKVTYLGHVVGQGQVLPREAKIQAILDFPIPTTKKELLRFLGMSGFYRKFVPNYSTVVSPLTNLLKAKVKYVWSDECQRSFEKLKAILVNEPVLAAPNFTKPFKVAIDACDVGVGAVLLQEDEEGIEKPVCYFSKKLNRFQKKYSTIEKEPLSLVLALQQFEDLNLLNQQSESCCLGRVLFLLPRLTDLKIKDCSFHDDFYREIADRASSSQIHTVTLLFVYLKKRQSESCCLGRVLSLLPRLTDLKIKDCSFHDDFYREIADRASSSQILTVTLLCVSLKRRRSESCCVGRVLSLLPRLTNLTINSCYFHDDFYRGIAGRASSSQIHTVKFNKLDLFDQQSGSCCLGRFLSLLPRLSDLTINYCHFHDDFYREIAVRAYSPQVDNTKIRDKFEFGVLRSKITARLICELDSA
nr:uncharacterized protein LOC129267850 [Lytechinus pictus]